MPSSMIQNVLEIEREAEAILSKAGADAKQMLIDAKNKRESDAKSHADIVLRDVRQIEETAAAERETKVRELAANGEAALSVVKNISDAAFDNGVRYIMDTLKTR